MGAIRRGSAGLDPAVVAPFVPQLARLAQSVPTGPDWVFEPKLDGFRLIVWRCGDHLRLASRNGRDLTNCFPEVAVAARDGLPPRCVVDGEIIAVTDGRLDFEALLGRLGGGQSPVGSRTGFIAFDLLVEGQEDLRPLSFARRRARLQELAGRKSGHHPADRRPRAGRRLAS